MRIHFWVTFPDGIFLDWFGEFCVLRGRVAIMVIALYGAKTVWGDAQRQPGLVQPHSTPNSEKCCQCHLSPTITDPQHCQGSHSGIVTAQTTKTKCKFNNSALGRRHLGLCLPHTTCHAHQLTHSSTAAVITGRSAPTRCLIMLP